MSGDINYKMKYSELKQKFMNSVDMAFRLGFEEGAKQEQQNQMAQQQQQAQLAAANANKAQPEEDGAAPEEGSQEPEQSDSQNPEGSELDQHIAKLESMLGKSEVSGDDLKKALDEVKSLQASIKLNNDLKKSARAIPEIAKALHKPSFKLGQVASHNMNSNAKAAVTMQHKIVSDMMDQWAQEEQKSSKDIKQILNLEGLIRKD